MSEGASLGGTGKEQETPSGISLSRRAFLTATTDALKFILFTAPGTYLAEKGFGTIFEISEEERKQQTQPKDNTIFIPESPISVNGINVQVNGVTHEIDTYLKHRDEIRKSIEHSPYVIMEYFEKNIRQLALPTIADETLRTPKTVGDSVAAFFAAIARDCAKQGKDIFVVSPETALMQKMELFLLVGLPSGVIPSEIWNDMKKSLNRKVSRRHLFRLAGLGISAAVWRSWIVENSDARTADQLRWNLIDFRDLCSAQGIQKVIQVTKDQIAPDQTIPLFQGAAHSSGTKLYLANPSLAASKKLAYPHYNLATNPISHYHYNPASNQWTLKETIPI